MKAQAAKGHRAKHSQTKKHHAQPAKHHPKKQVQGPTHAHQKVHAAAKGAKGHKPVGLALAEMAPCCAAEALAASLRLTGRPVSDADVLALYDRVARSPNAGASIWDALEAASRYGLAGVRPVRFEPIDPEEVMPSGRPDCRSCPGTPDLLRATRAGLILGVDLPGPHAVTAAGGCWSSWGGWWPPAAFPDAVIEEAWEVLWP